MSDGYACSLAFFFVIVIANYFFPILYWFLFYFHLIFLLPYVYIVNKLQMFTILQAVPVLSAPFQLNYNWALFRRKLSYQLQNVRLTPASFQYFPIQGKWYKFLCAIIHNIMSFLPDLTLIGIGWSDCCLFILTSQPYMMQNYCYYYT